MTNRKIIYCYCKQQIIIQVRNKILLSHYNQINNPKDPHIHYWTELFTF